MRWGRPRQRWLLRSPDLRGAAMAAKPVVKVQGRILRRAREQRKNWSRKRPTRQEDNATLPCWAPWGLWSDESLSRPLMSRGFGSVASKRGEAPGPASGTWGEGTFRAAPFGTCARWRRWDRIEGRENAAAGASPRPALTGPAASRRCLKPSSSIAPMDRRHPVGSWLVNV